ncbi:SH3 domain-containing kinase-binding protein 1 [Aphelenchoides bicaudatus]|nr:SH3 domain-containing kinase-binding protein 1 [Aphelenchoides bicaudatus]
MMASYTEQQQQISEAPTTGPGNVARLVDRLSKDISTLQKGVPMKPPKPNNNPTRTAQVRYSYVAQQEDELTLEEKDIIEVLEDVEDGWARGKLNDKVGVFPTNFVEFTVTPATNTSSYTSALSRVNEEPRKRPKEEQTNGKTDKTPPTSGSTNVLPSTFKASVRNKNGFSSTAASTAPTTTSTNTTATNNPPTTANKQSKETAKVLYEYKAINPDELELKEGDIITIVNRKCTDEGWCLGELNGKRGLFPENFVRIITGAGPPPSSAMSTSGSTAPPVLPAKPLKPTGGFPKQEASSGPAVTTRTSFKNGTKYTPTPQTNTTTTAASSDSTPSITTAPSQHKTLEERKSVVAGIQSRLFPQGKMPPHKPTFNPPSNVLTSSQHGHSDSNAPSVQMRHSVVDPTKMGGHFDSPESAGDEPKQLESLTKFRPKQSGKRPPSTQFRSSNMIKVDTPPQTPPQTPTAEAVSIGPSTTSFPAESRSPAQQSSPNNTNSRQQELHSAVKELDSIATAVSSVGNKASPTGQSTMGQKPSRNHSAGSTHSSFYKEKDAGNDSVDSTTTDSPSRAEFNDFKAEVFRRLAKLEEKILKLESGENNRQHF